MEGIIASIVMSVLSLIGVVISNLAATNKSDLATADAVGVIGLYITLEMAKYVLKEDLPDTLKILTPSPLKSVIQPLHMTALKQKLLKLLQAKLQENNMEELYEHTC